MIRDSEDEAWLDYRQRFSKVYDDSNYGDSLQGYVMRASHRLVERPFRSKDNFSRVVEVGAGTGEHLPFVRHRFNEYVLVDHDGEALEVARRKHGDRADLSFAAHGGVELPFETGTVDRLIATHVLEHIYQPHLALKEWARVLRPGGSMSILIPTDPGVAWRVARHLGPRRNAIAQGIAYDYVMAREHVNSCVNLIALLRFYFDRRIEAWWPTLLPSVDINLFFSFNATVHGGEDS